MRDIPDIVMELRESEKKGMLSQKKAPFRECLNGVEISQETPSNFPSVLYEEKKIFPTKDLFRCKDEELYKILVENLLEGIIILDIKGQILFANPAAVKMFGYQTSEEYIGKNASEIIDPSDHEQIKKDQILIKTGKGGFLHTYQGLTATGQKIWIEGLGTKIIYNNQTAIVLFIRDITERKKTWDELIKLEETYKAIAETSVDGIITLDNFGRLIYINPSFEKLCKKKKSDMMMTLFREYLSTESIYLFQQFFIEAWKYNKKIDDIELELEFSHNYRISIELNMSPLKIEDQFSGMLCTVRDITERKKLEHELRKSERLKTEFMNIAAHELKSPVTPIKGYLDLILSDETSNDNIKKWAKISMRNVERLLNLVNDILDVSRLDNDTMRFDMEKINLVELLEEIIEDTTPLIEQKNLQLILDVAKSLPPIMGDRYRLLQAIRNILDNAVKFTDENSITIHAHQKESTVLITIEDTGIGMDNADLKKIFTKFYQADTGTDRINEGTGLGLFICKQIIEKHNGKIWVESKRNQGSKFFIELPIL